MKVEKRIKQRRMEVFAAGFAARYRLNLWDEEADQMYKEIVAMETADDNVANKDDNGTIGDEGTVGDEGAVADEGAVGDEANMADDGVGADIGNNVDELNNNVVNDQSAVGLDSGTQAPLAAHAVANEVVVANEDAVGNESDKENQPHDVAPDGIGQDMPPHQSIATIEEDDMAAPEVVKPSTSV